MAKFYKKKNFIFPILLLIVISLFFFSGKLSNTSEKISSISTAVNFQPFPTQAPAQTTTEVHSADGEMKVVMRKVTKIASDLLIYIFTVSDINGGNPKVVFTTTLPDSQNMYVPANSFSPDNKYLFLKEGDGANEAFFVFKTSGETFSGGKTYIDVGPLFTAKITDYQLDEITGWDAETLLHIFTVSGKDRGPSYWFDIDSGNFLMLAHR